MAAGEIFAVLNNIKKQYIRYFNLVGKLYIVVQLICRVLIPQFVLDDMFGEPLLTCDTQQTACEQNCINRFTPINHQRLWEGQLLMGIVSLMIFSFFSFIHRMCKHSDKVEYGFNGRQKVSRIIRVGYISMLTFRLLVEITFLYWEHELAKHQSQNENFWEAFELKESWLCATNSGNPAAKRSLSKIIPPQNRSTPLWSDNENVACIQQSVVVTCWIPFSNMKSVWLKFMYCVLCLSTCLTAIELLWELVKDCVTCVTCRGKVGRGNSEYGQDGLLNAMMPGKKDDDEEDEEEKKKRKRGKTEKNEKNGRENDLYI